MNRKQRIEKAKEILKLPDEKRAKALLTIEDDKDFFLTTWHCTHKDAGANKGIRESRCVKDRAYKIRQETSSINWEKWLKEDGKK